MNSKRFSRVRRTIQIAGTMALLVSAFSLRADERATNSPSLLSGLKQADAGTNAFESDWQLPSNDTLKAMAADALVKEQLADTNAAVPEPGYGNLPTPAIASHAKPVTTNDIDYKAQLDSARKLRSDKTPGEAARILITLLESNAPQEIKRPALFELALVAQDDNKPVKAQQLYAQYLNMYPDDPTAPEVLLRQGLLYRQMGVTSLAISKFYAVMSTALKLKLDNIDYYKSLVLQAQFEIADTYYIEGKYTESADYFARLLKTGAPELDKRLVLFKLVRSLSNLTNYNETVARSQVYLDLNPNTSDVPEVRFMLASALKKLARNQESMKQVLLLLQSQQANVDKNPEVWMYWQRRAGNEIANQLFKEGDFVNSLEIYLNLSELDKSAAWQLPVWYQTGLVYEQLQQWMKATEIYDKMLKRQGEAQKDGSPGLISLFDMARWRKDHIAWMEKARATNQAFQRDSAAKASSSGGQTAAK